MIASLLALLLTIGSAAPALSQDRHDHEKLPLNILLMLITSSARERFRPIMTYRVEMRPSRDEYYNSKYTLPEAEWCRIFEHPQLVFACEWKSDRKRAIGDFVKQYQDALGEGWKRTDKEPKGRRTAVFDYPDRRGDISMEIYQTTTGIRLTLRSPDRAIEGH
jgi:hypothetical protein